MFSFCLKISPLMEPPFLLFGTGHHERAKAQDAMGRRLKSPDPHRLIKDLQSDLFDEDSACIEGADVQELPGLAVFIGGLRFAVSVERMVEGEHAKLLRDLCRAPNLSTAYTSLAKRMPEIQAAVEDRDSFIELADCLQEVRSPRLCARKLGFEAHPTFEQASCGHAWNPLYGQLIYHADTFSLQSQLVPEGTLSLVKPSPSLPKSWGFEAEAPPVSMLGIL